MTEGQAPAGWYPDPMGDTTKVRYWNGLAWTNQTLDVTNPQSITGGYASQGFAQTPAPGFAEASSDEVYKTPARSSEQLQQQPFGQPPYSPLPGQSSPYQQQQTYQQPGQFYQQPYPASIAEENKAGLWLGIGIASIILLTWPIAIAQIINASGARTAYQYGDLAGYKSKIKISKTCFIINLCVMAAFLSCIIITLTLS